MYVLVHVDCISLFCCLLKCFTSKMEIKQSQLIFLMSLFQSHFHFVRLSLLTMTNPNQLCDVLLFVCSKMADETILALNCLLQIEQERSEEESSVCDALALAFRCACFCSASLILFASYSPAPLFMRQCVLLIKMTCAVNWIVVRERHAVNLTLSS